MKRALIAIATGLLVATLVPITSNAADPLPRQTATSNCESGKADSVEVVLLVDQSTSLREGDGLAAIEEAVKQVGNRLRIPTQDNLNVRFGAATFGLEADTLRPLQPVENVDFEDLGDELSNKNSLDDSTNYVAGLEEAIKLFDEGDPQACKVLLWFTDGTVDLEDVGDEKEAADLVSAVCGDERPIARRIGSKGIVTYAVLLNTEEQVKKWNESSDSNEKNIRLEAGLSSMQAIAGVDKITGAENHVPNDKCVRLIAENSKLGGEVLVEAGELAGILSTRLCDALGCNKVGQCPETVPVGDSGLFPERGMPPGVMLSNVYVTELAGEIDSVSAVLPDGTRKPLDRPNKVDNRLNEAQLKQLPGGWQLEISGRGQEALEVCIQYDKPELDAGEVIVTPLPISSKSKIVVFEEQETIELIVDWSEALGVDNAAGVIDEWSLSGDRLTESGTLFDPDSVVEVSVAELGDADGDGFELDSVTLTVTPQGSEEKVVFDGRIEPSITVQTDSDAPGLTCTEDGKHGFGIRTIGRDGEEVTEGKRYESPGTCTVSAPNDEESFVTVTFDHDDLVMPWELQKKRGEEFVAVTFDETEDSKGPNSFKVRAGEDDVVLRVATPEDLKKDEVYLGGGELKLSTEWSRNADYSPGATFKYTVDLIPRSNPWQAGMYTLIVTAIATLLSLALLRLMNHLLVKIPEPGAFYFRAVPVKISPDPVLGATWSPTGDGFASESRPVGANSPGRDLKAGPLRVHRTLSPVWKPFAPPFSRLKGDRVIRSTPSGRRAGTAPVAFPSLTALMTSGDEQSTDGSFAGQIVVLYPRRHEFDETQVRQDVDRLVGPVGEDLGRLTPESSKTTHDGPDESGGRPPGRPDPEPAPRGSGPSAPPTRSGPQPGPAQDTTTSDREPPRREPPRREPPPRRS